MKNLRENAWNFQLNIYVEPNNQISNLFTIPLNDQVFPIICFCCKFMNRDDRSIFLLSDLKHYRHMMSCCWNPSLQIYMCIVYEQCKVHCPILLIFKFLHVKVLFTCIQSYGQIFMLKEGVLT